MLFLVAIGVLAAPLAATEQHGVQFAARGAYAPITGFGQGDFADLFDAFIPVGIEIGYRLHSNLYLGGYLEYSQGIDSCPFEFADERDCSGHGVGVGGDFRYYVSPGSLVVPWFGITAGYQRSRAFATDRDDGRFFLTVDELRTGLAAGLDLRLWKGFTVGPYIAGKIASGFSGSIHGEQTGISNDRGGVSSALLELGFRVGFGP
jgi:hypothetical protein